MADCGQAGYGPEGTSLQASESMNTGSTTWSVAWRRQFQREYREKVTAQVQAIVSAGHVLAPSKQSKLRSYTAGSGGSGGTLEWTATVGAPIRGSVAADGTNVYVADTWGRVAAYRLSDGANVWGPRQITDGKPFHCSLRLAAGLLLIGGADGMFYMLDPANGSVVHSYNAGAPILQTCAWSNGTGTPLAIVASMDMRVRAINTSTGAQAWVTSPLGGSAFKDYWPVITGTKILIRPQVKYPYWSGGFPAPLQTPARGLDVLDFTSSVQMAAALASYDGSPSSYIKSLYVLDLATGAEQPAPIHWYHGITMNGGAPPPCIDAAGYVVIPAISPTGTTGWVRLDLTARTVHDALVDGSPYAVGHGWGNADENMCVSACSNGIFAMHYQEANAQTTGFYRQTDNTWHVFGPGAATSELLTFNESAGTSIAVVSGGVMYHICAPDTLVCWKAT